MATVLTESDTFSPTVTGPDDGDTRNAASVNSAFQSLTNRTRRLLNSLVGELRWGGGIRTDTAVAGLGVFVAAIQACMIGERLLSQAAETEVPGTLPLANDTWYGIYAYDNAGTLTLQASADPRDVTGVWKSTGLLTHRYVGSFRTGGAGLPIDMRAIAGHYRWLTAPATRTALTAGTSTGGASVACAAYAPPHARVLCLSTSALESGASAKTANLSDITSAVAQLVLQVPASVRASERVELACTSGQAIAYAVSSVDLALTLVVDGWRE